MRDHQLLFTAALGLTPPWKVTKINFSAANKQLDIHIDFPPGSTFVCPVCGRDGAHAYDTTEKTWRHLNFFQHRTYLHARVPRVECSYGCGIKTVEVPWSRPESGFTLLFEAFIMTLAREMPVKAIAELVGEHDTRLWRILHHYVHQARAQQDFSEVTKVGVDETSAKRGHDYITLFMDLENSRLYDVSYSFLLNPE